MVLLGVQIKGLLESLSKESTASDKSQSNDSIELLHYWTKWPILNSEKSLIYRRIKINLQEKIAHDIIYIIQNTWNSQLVGQGNDAKNLHHSNIKVKSIVRIENPEMYLKYAQSLNSVTSEMGRISARNTHHSMGRKMLPPKTMSCGRNMLTSSCKSAATEVFLFHGTKRENISAIIGRGLDCRLARPSMFGKGLYFADSSTKADQYAGILV